MESCQPDFVDQKFLSGCHHFTLLQSMADLMENSMGSSPAQ